jgi:hypothetical protein
MARGPVKSSAAADGISAGEDNVGAALPSSGVHTLTGTPISPVGHYAP